METINTAFELAPYDWKESEGRWWERAACKNNPRGDWAAEFSKAKILPERVAKALEICNTGCPVRIQCLKEAMEQERPHLKRHTIRGGLRPKERDALHKLLRRAS